MSMTEPRAAPVERELAARAPVRIAGAADELAAILSASLGAGYPAGASLSVVDQHGSLLRMTAGWSCVVDERIPTSSETLYDLASLTKVVATVPLCLMLARRGAWTLDDPVVRWVPDFPRADITLRRLLTHTSGLVPHREFFRLGRGEDVIRPAVFAEAIDAAPGPVAYSDLNYILLGWALACCSGMPLDRLFAEAVAKPLGMSSAGFRPPAAMRERTAATELDGDQRLTPGLVWGEVHDGNAWALGGVSGHAGLFATVDDVSRFACSLLKPEGNPVLDAAWLREMTRQQAGSPPDVRALGWRLGATHWGAWPVKTYWHTGFTGTSLLVDPTSQIAVVLLTGGVHPVRRPDELAALRCSVHHVVAAACR